MLSHPTEFCGFCWSNWSVELVDVKKSFCWNYCAWCICRLACVLDSRRGSAMAPRRGTFRRRPMASRSAGRISTHSRVNPSSGRGWHDFADDTPYDMLTFGDSSHANDWLSERVGLLSWLLHQLTDIVATSASRPVRCFPASLMICYFLHKIQANSEPDNQNVVAVFEQRFSLC